MIDRTIKQHIKEYKLQILKEIQESAHIVYSKTLSSIFPNISVLTLLIFV